MKFDDYLQEQLKDENVKKEYDKLTPIYNIIKQTIAERKEQNLTQKDLAEKTGLKQANISRFENGNANPTIEFLEKIAKGLGKELHIELR